VGRNYLLKTGLRRLAQGTGQDASGLDDAVGSTVLVAAGFMPAAASTGLKWRCHADRFRSKLGCGPSCRQRGLPCVSPALVAAPDFGFCVGHDALGALTGLGSYLVTSAGGVHGDGEVSERVEHRP
jgi:hypothetical protein